jgi:uncharacterized RDD family membrane protein YckC
MTGACPKCGWQPVDGAACPRCGVDLASYRVELAEAAPALVAPEGVPATPARAVGGRAPAGFWLRAVAVLIDVIAVAVVHAILAGVLGALAWALFGTAPLLTAVAVRLTAALFAVVLGIVYPIAFHWAWGQTLGKMAMRVQVVMSSPTELWPGWREDGALPSLRCAVIRQVAWGYSASILGIGFAIAGLREDRRALHDLVGGTRVERLS